jgi:hypothetical protein
MHTSKTAIFDRFLAVLELFPIALRNAKMMDSALGVCVYTLGVEAVSTYRVKLPSKFDSPTYLYYTLSGPLRPPQLNPHAATFLLGMRSLLSPLSPVTNAYNIYEIHSPMEISGFPSDREEAREGKLPSQTPLNQTPLNTNPGPQVRWSNQIRNFPFHLPNRDDSSTYPWQHRSTSPTPSSPRRCRCTIGDCMQPFHPLSSFLGPLSMSRTTQVTQPCQQNISTSSFGFPLDATFSGGYLLHICCIFAT